ncbi:MAG: YicC/YloC family endoribonuclease [Bdellovibrionota bacterium]|nr:YicC/YloC family endoribonuclease [Bdellovibrionota bacterium]
MKSMTGFAALEAEIETLKLSLRVRCVNSRFFEFKPHLPPDFYPVESEIKKNIQEKLKRGSVDLYVHRKKLSKSASANVVADENLAKNYAKAYKALAKNLKISEELEMPTLAKVPGVFNVEENLKLSKLEKNFLFSSLEKLLTACEKERVREGKAIAEDLNSILGSLENEVKQIAAYREEANADLEKRLHSRLEKFGLKSDMDEARIAQEVVIQIDKADITEELLRLKEHFKEFKRLLKAKEAVVGKRLDFYSQELLREVNTIGSKSQHSSITKHIVESKGMIERIREIVQNVE